MIVDWGGPSVERRRSRWRGRRLAKVRSVQYGWATLKDDRGNVIAHYVHGMKHGKGIA